MILGFAHVTDNWEGHRLFPGDTFVVPSAPEKWPLMAKQATSHNLFVRPRNGIMTEVIRYDTGVVMKHGRLRVDDGSVHLMMRDVAVEEPFLLGGLGFCQDRKGWLSFESRLPNWSVRLSGSAGQDAPIDPPLDIAGYAAIAFYSTDVEADRDHLLKHGGRTPTKPFTVKLDREMKIVMLRSPEGTIIELIQVLK